MASRRSFFAVAICIGAFALTLSAQQQALPVFVGRADIVAVDVQVVDREGLPIDNLRPPDFEVWINGHPRTIASADLIQFSRSTTVARPSVPVPAPLGQPGANGVAGARVIVLAVDESGFTVGSWMAAKQAALRFLDHAQPEDLIGLYVYPFNEPALALAHDRAVVRRALEAVVGRSELLTGRIYIGPSEIVDIVAGDGQTLAQVTRRECSRGDPSCNARLVQMEASQRAQYAEVVATQSLGAFRTLLTGLATLPGPKTIALMSGGLMNSDRVGGRPDVSTRLQGLGRDAAAADANLYVIHIDDSFFDSISVARNPSADGSAKVVNQMKDAHTLANGLERLAGEAGGSYLQIAAGTADRAFDRVLRETSAYYLLAVNTDPADRDGRQHVLRVSVHARGATVRHRTAVVIPKVGSAAQQ